MPSALIIIYVQRGLFDDLSIPHKPRGVIDRMNAIITTPPAPTSQALALKSLQRQRTGSFFESRFDEFSTTDSIAYIVSTSTYLLLAWLAHFWI